MLALGRRAVHVVVFVAAAASSLAAVALWGGGAARPFAIYVGSTALAVVLVTLLEPVLRSSGRRV